MAWLDRLLGFLLGPRVRTVRRWSFLVTLPAAVLVAWAVDLEGGFAVLAARVALWAAVALAAWRAGGERGEALRDVLMHPRARAFLRAELDVLLALPRLLVGSAARPAAGLSYARGDHGLALALAFTPAILAETLALELALPSAWVAIHVVSAALHGYMLLWLWGWALGPRAYPHRLAGGVLDVRNGPLYRARVPLAAVARATARRERVGGEEHGLVARDDAILLPARRTGGSVARPRPRGRRAPGPRGATLRTAPCAGLR